MPISLINACLSMSTCNNAITTEQIFMKFEIGHEVKFIDRQLISVKSGQ
jgi:hypothetical protein